MSVSTVMYEKQMSWSSRGRCWKGNFSFRNFDWARRTVRATTLHSRCKRKDIFDGSGYVDDKHSVLYASVRCLK